jgi:hypothetical protein
MSQKNGRGSLMLPRAGELSAMAAIPYRDLWKTAYYIGTGHFTPCDRGA